MKYISNAQRMCESPILKTYGQMTDCLHFFGFVPFKWSCTWHELFLDRMEGPKFTVTLVVKFSVLLSHMIVLSSQVARIMALDIPLVIKLGAVFQNFVYTLLILSFVIIFSNPHAIADIINSSLAVRPRNDCKLIIIIHA